MEPIQKRGISVALYAAALVLALLVFAAGILIGEQIDRANMAGISSDVDRMSQRVASIQLLMLMDGNSSAFCPVYESELASLDVDVQKVGYRLTYMEREKLAFDPALKKQYFILETESYLLSRRVKEICGDNSTLLLYFYSNKNCSSCLAQGDEILRARDALLQKKTVKIYSYDGDLGSPVAKALMDGYNVTAYPSVVIDGVTYSGYRSAYDVQKLLGG